MTHRLPCAFQRHRDPLVCGTPIIAPVMRRRRSRRSVALRVGLEPTSRSLRSCRSPLSYRSWSIPARSPHPTREWKGFTGAGGTAVATGTGDPTSATRRVSHRAPTETRTPSTDRCTCDPRVPYGGLCPARRLMERSACQALDLCAAGASPGGTQLGGSHPGRPSWSCVSTPGLEPGIPRVRVSPRGGHRIRPVIRARPTASTSFAT